MIDWSRLPCSHTHGQGVPNFRLYLSRRPSQMLIRFSPSLNRVRLPDDLPTIATAWAANVTGED
ncbi:MAG: hypothetical protein WBX22_00130 [Silvibacterium sp.]